MKKIDETIRTNVRFLLALFKTNTGSLDHKIFTVYAGENTGIKADIESLDKHFKSAGILVNSFDQLMTCFLLCFIASFFYVLLLVCHLTDGLTIRGEVIYAMSSYVAMVSIPGILLSAYLLHLQWKYEKTIQLVDYAIRLMKDAKEVFPNIEKLEEMPAWIKDSTLEVVKFEHALEDKNSLTAAQWERLSLETGRARIRVYRQIDLAAILRISNGDRTPYFDWAEAKYAELAKNGNAKFNLSNYLVF